jgi:hypothetical protein
VTWHSSVLCTVTSPVSEGNSAHTTVPGTMLLRGHLLRWWLQVSRQPTIGDGRFGGSPLIKVAADGREFVLDRDTERCAVASFTEAAARARETRNRMPYLPDDGATPS